jgi:hypothetical protein
MVPWHAAVGAAAKSGMLTKEIVGWFVSIVAAQKKFVCVCVLRFLQVMQFLFCEARFRKIESWQNEGGCIPTTPSSDAGVKLHGSLTIKINHK